ncbi:MAG TPA: DUF4349 domain-containing protein, partial [Polyangiaceae bacterium]|nr:DUF4349 domain-containing protein [Polyangiaceae bacterium]
MLFRRRTRSPFHALFLTACLASTACGVASKPAMAPNDAAPREVSSAEAAPAPSAQAAPAEPRPVAAGVPALPSVPGAPPGPHAGTAEVAVDPELDRAKRMVDIEATFRVEVMDVGVATGKLRKLAFDAGGTVANETVTANAGTNANAELTLRVPVGKADSLFSALEGLGVLRSRNVSERDVGREYYDSVLRLRNLGVTRDRLEDVLRRATEVKDILTVEAELSRVR